jgi:hypothetical protein
MLEVNKLRKNKNHISLFFKKGAFLEKKAFFAVIFAINIIALNQINTWLYLIFYDKFWMSCHQFVI